MKTIKVFDITSVAGHDIEPGMVIAEGVVLSVEPHYVGYRAYTPTHYTLRVTSPAIVQVSRHEEIEVLAKVEQDLLDAFLAAVAA